MRKTILIIILAAMSVALGACTESTPTPIGTAPSPSASPSASPYASPTADDKNDDDDKDDNDAEDIAGNWTGVEGTYLNVTRKKDVEDKDGDKFSIEIKDLDKTETFEGTAKGDVIEFTRNGKTETIKHATGEETGMKYLLEEKNCVVITKGSEGYCRK